MKFPFRFHSLFLLVSCLQLVLGGDKTKCDTCKIFVNSFVKGLKKTEKSHFGGGNTAWEEEKIGQYRTSETRLVEVLENACKNDLEGKELGKNDESMCHSFAEEHEESIENWYFHKQSGEPDLTKWLCHTTLVLCCPGKLWGPDCSPCPGDPENPCFGRGDCDGAGTREGTGKCKCNKGYVGKLCRKCSSNHYSVSQNDTYAECANCDKSCKGGCKGAGPGLCNDCKPGWLLDAEKGCQDVDECESPVCTGVHEVCHNTPGSYDCKCAADYKRGTGEQCVPDPIEATSNDTDTSTEDSDADDNDIDDGGDVNDAAGDVDKEEL